MDENNVNNANNAKYDECTWTEEKVEAAVERQRERFLAFMNSGLSMTKWIKERECTEE